MGALETSVIVLGAFAFIGVIVPLAKVKLGEAVSYRMVLVGVVAALMIGVILDLSHLSDDVRYAVVLGGLVIIGIFVLMRSLEHWVASGWLSLHRQISVHYKDADVRFGESEPTSGASTRTKTADAEKL